ncbi:MAG: PilX N-terminal domain-containing pilus assembly protein [Comamonadaceae bacterium]|nr:PilX N-terminal domain-containing pilus assembly protein [Comamonadaceae bacterium]RRD56911.1 pilus assembly protein PilX [Comamonadaceae bacterium OH2545_COT-014]
MRTYSTTSLARQRGISLFIILVVVLLSTLLALWASRSALLNEMIVGNDADYQRAFEAAQAMIQDAELDIQGLRADGARCQPVTGNTQLCRPAASAIFFPDEIKEFGPLMSALDAEGTKCKNGICQKRTGVQDFWRHSSTLDPMLEQGARYGQYTGATTAESNTSSNPILNDRGTSSGAWYWVEVMRYADANKVLMSSTPGANMFAYAPTASNPFVYRITALAKGRRPGTQVVLQSVFVQKRRD